MNSRVTTIVCPNCGANTTNHHNCEFCGSLWVRYTSENKVVDSDVFGKDSKEIPGLKEELKKNLSYQKIKKTDDVVVTTITDSNDLMYQIVETAHCNFGAVGNNPFEGQYERGVTLRVTFETRDEDEDYAEIEKIRLASFKQRDDYFLFTQQNHPSGVYYYIDFGEDIDNASKLVSSIITADNDDNDETAYYLFDTKMVNSRNLVNIGGTLVDTTKDKAKKQFKIATIIGVVVGYILFLIISLIA